ncbi:PREDICTED: E3 ubiquitin-protein ligase PUB23-like [Nelumbo nucifera]|uniref:U-box domain-containing protein n=2 Tax=Nelumbo nucifera TaxID=4432 RepID=A0A822YCE1_NELNU|nr:PREDICTED: E3 ubiquitin-protein ligase PUB23-like [Nelumbo nucifera]DAD28959.1 TPA_asm: hypothetical protein HUJ06_030427 [Nelumbo nucifera]
MEEIDIDVPPYFLCPISLEIMRDPVTVSTGITYDRQCIERWIFTVKNNTCPVTKQILSDVDLIPNHTLRRLIQAWCILNASKGIERFPTPKPPVDKAEIAKILKDAKLPQSQMRCLRTLRSIASESDRNKRCMEAAGVVEFLAAIVKNDNSTSMEDSVEDELEFTRASDEALSILCHLQISQASLKSLVMSRNSEFVESLLRVLQRGNYQSRAYAALLLKSMFEVADPNQLISLKPKLFVEIVNVLRDQISTQASKAALQVLIEVCPWGRNRIKAVEADAVAVVIDLLLDTFEKRACEMMLVVLDQLCGCAEGRSELLKHSAGIAVVSKKILRVSHLATERGVRILSSISRFSATSGVVQEMLHLGVVSKLCLVLQVDCGVKTMERARDILRLHSRAWKNSPCILPRLRSFYPSS